MKTNIPKKRPPVKPEKDSPIDPDKKPDTGQNDKRDPKKNDPTRIEEPPETDPTRRDDPPPVKSDLLMENKHINMYQKNLNAFLNHCSYLQ